MNVNEQMMSINREMGTRCRDLRRESIERQGSWAEALFRLLCKGDGYLCSSLSFCKRLEVARKKN